MPRLYLVLAGILVATAPLGLAQTPDDPGISMSAGAMRRHRASVHYPRSSPVAGTVEIEASFNVRGEVTDAHVVSGPEELRKDFVSGILESIEFTGLASDAERELRSRLPYQEGDSMLRSDFDKINGIVQQFDEHLTADVTGRIAAPDAHRDLTIHIHAGEAVEASRINSQEPAEKPRVTLRK